MFDGNLNRSKDSQKKKSLPLLNNDIIAVNSVSTNAKPLTKIQNENFSFVSTSNMNGKDYSINLLVYKFE